MWHYKIRAQQVSVATHYLIAVSILFFFNEIHGQSHAVSYNPGKKIAPQDLASDALVALVSMI